MDKIIRIYNLRIRTISLICIILLITTTNHAQDQTEKVKKMIRQNKCELAIQTLDEEIINKPEKVGVATELCFSEGAKLWQKGDYKDADLLSKYAITITRTHRLAFPNSFSDYLLCVNNRDSIINLAGYIIQVYPESYENIQLIINRLNAQLKPIEADIYPSIFVDYKDGYSNVSWLFPSNSTPDFCKERFGMSTFSPITSYYFSSFNLSQIISMSTENIFNSIQNDILYTPDGYVVSLHFSSVPELSSYFADLKNKTKFQIASEKENIIKNIIEVREKYLIANLKYSFTSFEVVGKCFAFQDEYDFDEQEALIHMFLVNSRYNQENTVYVATAKVRLSLDDAKYLFTSNEVEGKVIYIMTPGVSRKNLGIAGGGVADQVMPNMLLIEDPKIVFENKLKSSVQFIVEGLKGELWPYNVNTGRWDMNKGGHQPYNQNMRLVVGKKY